AGCLPDRARGGRRDGAAVPDRGSAPAARGPPHPGLPDAAPVGHERRAAFPLVDATAILQLQGTDRHCLRLAGLGHRGHRHRIVISGSFHTVTLMDPACNVCRSRLGAPIYESAENGSITTMNKLIAGRTRVFFCEACGHLQTSELPNLVEYYAHEYEV